MECSIVYAGGCRQIMLTPENEPERQAIKAMQTEDGEKMQVCMRLGHFDNKPEPAGFAVARCKAGYFRRFADQESLMIEISSKQGDEE